MAQRWRFEGEPVARPSPPHMERIRLGPRGGGCCNGGIAGQAPAPRAPRGWMVGRAPVRRRVAQKTLRARTETQATCPVPAIYCVGNATTHGRVSVSSISPSQRPDRRRRGRKETSRILSDAIAISIISFACPVTFRLQFARESVDVDQMPKAKSKRGECESRRPTREHGSLVDGRMQIRRPRDNCPRELRTAHDPANGQLVGRRSAPDLHEPRACFGKLSEGRPGGFGTRYRQETQPRMAPAEEAASRGQPPKLDGNK